MKSTLPASLKGYRIHMVGIKGTGMTALAEILFAYGARLSGSDTPEIFYTDRILQELKIPYKESFSSDHIDSSIQIVIHSPAYNKHDNAEIDAAYKAGLPVLSFPEAVGELSGRFISSGISGMHGKTTTTAMAGILMKALKLPATVWTGTEVSNFGNRSSLILGNRYFISETCEYRRNFLKFKPDNIIITCIEPEHLDYFKDFKDILQAFESYCLLLPEGGSVIYNHDDSGNNLVIERLRKKRKDIVLIPYGRSAEGDFRIKNIVTAGGETRFTIGSFPGDFILKLPGEFSAYNAAAVLALTARILENEGRSAIDTINTFDTINTIKAAFKSFKGCRRRHEVLGEAKGVLFIDDYGHHPTEIRKTLEGFKSFYTGRRIFVDFMPHTYSRTRLLLKDFSTCFAPAHHVVLHKIYASAREISDHEITGESLYEAVKNEHPRVHYFPEPDESICFFEKNLTNGDLLVTMGAGDNWKLGRELYSRFKRNNRE